MRREPHVPCIGPVNSPLGRGRQALLPAHRSRIAGVRVQYHSAITHSLRPFPIGLIRPDFLERLTLDPFRDVDWSIEVADDTSSGTASRCQVLGVTTPKRVAIAPDIPTIAEAGIADLVVDPRDEAELDRARAVIVVGVIVAGVTSVVYGAIDPNPKFFTLDWFFQLGN